MFRKSHPKNSQNATSLPTSQENSSKKEEHSALFSNFSLIDNKISTAFLTIFAIILGFIGNPLTENYSLSSCLFCLSIIIILILVCIIFMFQNKKAITKLNKKIKKTNNPKKKHVRKIKKLLIWRTSIFCFTVFGVVFMSVPVLCTMLFSMQDKIQQISFIPSSTSDTKKNDSAGTKISNTPPAPTVVPNPTFTPVPYDESQMEFDTLWNTYFSNFCHENYANISEAISVAQNIVNTLWVHRKKESSETWPLEEIDIYGLSSGCYQSSLEYENILRYNSSPAILNNAGETYVSNTSTHIQIAEINGINLTERDLGLGSLRGIDLFAQYLTQNPESVQAGSIYDSMAILLRHCADNLYYEHETLSLEEHTRRFAFNIFSYVCYVQAQKHHYTSSQLDNDIKEMKKSIENTF